VEPGVPVILKGMLTRALEDRLRSLLQQHGGFALLGKETLHQLARKFDLVSFKLGEMIFHEGERDDCGYLVHSGKARVYRPGTTGHTISLGTFTPGDFFGAHANPRHWERTISCRAAEATLLFRIARPDFEDLLHACPALSSYFGKRLEQAALLRFLRLDTLLGTLPVDQVIAVVIELQECAFQAGETIVREGANSDRVYIIRSGAVQMRRAGAGRERVLAELSEGKFFGVRSLLLNEPRSTTVVALRDTTCFSLNRPSFERLMTQAPLLIAYLVHRLDRHYRGDEPGEGGEEIVLVPVARQAAAALRQSQPGLALSLDASLDQAVLLQFLRVQTVLSGLPAHQVLAVLRELQECSFQAGEILIRAGETPGRMDIIRSGAAKVVRGRPGQETVVSYLGAGDSFGERSLVLNEPPPAAVIALQDIESFRLSSDSFERLAATAPHLREHLARRGEADPLYGADPPSALQRLPPELQRERPPDGAPPQAAAGTETGPSPRDGRRGLRPLYGTSRRYPWMPQQEETDCGVTCLAMVALAHGVALDAAQLQALVRAGRQGASMASLGEAAEMLGFSWRALKTEYAHLAELTLPAVAHWKECHYVVLYAVRARSVLIGDPAVGLIKMSRQVFERGWTGRLLLLTPASRAEPPGQ
jgi:CRP-like cAMP-binding protein